MHVGAVVDPSVTATFTVSDEPALNWALDPPALPTILNSAWLQPLAIAVRLSATDALKADVPKVVVATSFPPDVAEPESVRVASWVIGICPLATRVAGVF